MDIHHAPDQDSAVQSPHESPLVVPDTALPVESEKSTTQRVPFWVVMLSLSLLSFISALDVTILPPALPTIVEDIGGSTQFTWIANIFVLASAALQPLFGQLADLIGRKSPTIASIVLFILGSGLAARARSSPLLIAGRGVQGIGAGGIYVLIDIICCDLVPLRERGKYLAIVQAGGGVAAALGPVIGGVLAEHNWRWIFYINFPICALPLLAIAFFMDVHTGNGHLSINDIDYLGNLIFIPSTTAVLLGLVTGGVEYPWSSWRVIVPLVLGVGGWVAFAIQQFYATTPSLPLRLFSNRTSATGFWLNFLSSVLLQTLGYFLPVYFQAVLGTTVSASGVAFLPITIGTLVFAALSGIIMSKSGHYKFLHFVAFASCTVGCGLLTTIGHGTPTVAWVFFEIILSIGLGVSVSTILPATLAALPQSDVAAASAAFAFVRSFGFALGVTVASVIFTNTIDKHLDMVSAELQSLLSHRKAYAFASQVRNIARKFTAKEWNGVVAIYTTSLKTVWWFALGVSATSFVLTMLEKNVMLSTELNTEYGLRGKRTTREGVN
ncbi:major facilitator superfamily domain-containing protein [Nemania sp. FL0916]|nr:major facilitator superfamily domain-containing protein [Nemania sp. FL0916]